MNLVLGIDTSAYTTSLALISQTGELIEDVRQVLEVEEGKEGCGNRGSILTYQEHSFVICRIGR